MTINSAESIIRRILNNHNRVDSIYPSGYTVDDISDLLKINDVNIPEDYVMNVCLALCFLPRKVVDDCTQRAIFLCTPPGVYAYYSSWNFGMNQDTGIIFLCESLHKERTQASIIYTIIHEIAHQQLRHDLVGGSSKDVFRRREREANQKTKQWVRAAEKLVFKPATKKGK